MTVEVHRMDEAEIQRLQGLDDKMGWVNATGLEDREVKGTVERIGRELAEWVSRQREAGRTGPSLLDRSAYVMPTTPYGMMETARKAVAEDDIVGGVADVTEGLAFQGIKWEGENADDADIFNQISRDLNLDDVIRTWWRESYTYSQVVCGMWWGWKEYTVRGFNPPEIPPLEKKADPATGVEVFEEPRDPETNRPVKRKKGSRRRKKYRVYVPTGFTFLDPQRVVPIGSGMFGVDRLAWHASKAEMALFNRILDGEISDPVMARFMIGKYTPSFDEAQSLAQLQIDPKRLIELNPDFVWRHCLTKPDYQRFPDVRLAGAFPLLDLKQQLMEADRVMLVGAANYILLIKKGDKDDPADNRELSNLRENFKVLAKLPVIISDHRLTVEIITPAQDMVLEAGKYDTLDRRILNRCLGALTVTGTGQRNESTLTVARGVARLLESRRKMIKREMERRIARAVMEHPFNADKFEDEPNLAFTPRNVQLDNDSQIVQAVLNLRTQNELSRESVLEYLGFDQEVEAQRREHEEESGLDEIFQTKVPFDSPMNGQPPAAQGAFGAQGGRPQGGGQSPQSPQGQTRKRTSSNNPSTKG